MATVGALLHTQFRGRETIGALVAGNSGRPAGAVGLPTELCHDNVHGRHRTQEEDLVSTWLVAECGGGTHAARAQQTHAYLATIAGRWGMADPRGTSKRTLQGVDYTRGNDPAMYADAWTVRDAWLCTKNPRKRHREFVLSDRYPVTLVFVAGPNAGVDRGASSTTGRTKHPYAVRDYRFFREGVKHAVRTGLDAMAREGVSVALIARVSCGIYAGSHNTRINAEFEHLVEELLRESVGPCGEARGRYFEAVVMPLLA